MDGGNPFHIAFEATEARYNGKKVDLENTGRIELTRSQAGDDYFMEVILKADTQVYLHFDCCIDVQYISPSSIQVVRDGEPPFAVGVSLTEIGQEENLRPFADDFPEYSYRRKSGEDHAYVMLVFEDRRLRFWFARTFSMGILPIAHDPELSAMMKDMTPPGWYTDDRYEAYRVQRIGMRALRRDTKEEWEKVIPTKAEISRLRQEITDKRRKTWEDACQKVDSK